MKRLAWGWVQGLALAVILIASVGILTGLGWAHDLIRTSVFIALVSGVFMFVLASRSSRRAPGAGNLVRNPWLMRLALMAVALMALVLGLEPLRGLMGFALPTQGSALAIALILAAEALAMVLLHASRFARRSRPAPS